MKKYIIILALAFSFALSAQSSQAETMYNDFNIFINNQKVGEVAMSYDTYRSCVNNFLINNTSRFGYIIYFDVYLNNVWKYNGWAKIHSGRMFKFNDAFSDCNSKNKKVKLVISSYELY